MYTKAFQDDDDHGVLHRDVASEADLPQLDLAYPTETAVLDRHQSRRTLTRLALLGVAASAGFALFARDDTFGNPLAPHRWEPLALAALASASLALGVGDRDLKRHIRWTTAALTAALVTVLLTLATLHTRWAFAAHSLFTTAVVLWLAACLLPAVLRCLGPLNVAVVGPEVQRDWLQRCMPKADYISQPRCMSRLYDIVAVSPCALADPGWSRFISEVAMSGCEVWPLDIFLEENAGRIPCTFSKSRLHHTRRTTRIYLRVKRALDLLIVVLFSVPALLAVLLAATAILITMGRPVLYSQDRVSLHGRIFRMHKLRTMRIQNTSGPQIATEKNDKRITPLGAFLRRFHIDELPQFWNILVGDMTLIGPRPEQPALVKKYTCEIPNFALRHNVKPGILGWAQLRYGYASTVEETREKLEYDLFYVRRISLTLDLKILWQTVPLMLNKNHVR
jgi:lipopolysaccharide/colanic/teichoic acid biosynthesis glycosyltransferase